MSETFDPVQEREPVTAEQIRMISGALGSIQTMILRLGEVDLDAGAGIVNGHTKCLWTKDGRRITFDVGFGTFIGSISDTPDPTREP